MNQEQSERQSGNADNGGETRLNRSTRGTLEHWSPEDPTFWQKQGARVASRNLWISIPALTLAFIVWMVWSAVVVKLPAIGFAFNDQQLFWLTALPGLSGATFRGFYSFVVPIFGGRNWTVISTASLLLPLIGMAYAVQDPATPYWIFIVLALLAGLGGGNFASSMSNISFFYPKQKKGLALGLNAGLGNLGVSIVQFTVPLVIGVSLFGALGGGAQLSDSGESLYLQNAALIWVPIIVIVVVAAWFGMNNLNVAKASFSEQKIIFRRKHTWLMSWLYVGTFGSFIGFSAAFPMLIRTQFPTVDPLDYAFLGPLIGALVRPVGGWISDKVGGARVTFVNFILMIAGVVGVIYFLADKGDAAAFIGFFISFMVLFLTTGIGNGSTFKMIPVIFRTKQLEGIDESNEEEHSAAVRRAEKESAAVIGFSSAVAAYGAFIIPQASNFSINATGGIQAALYGMIVFYASCLYLTWRYYSRKGAEVPC